MVSQKANNVWVLLLCMLSGLTVGYFIGNLCENVSFLKWMNFTGSFGLDNPVAVNLGVIWISFQIKFKITLAAIVGMLVGVFVYRKI